MKKKMILAGAFSAILALTSCGGLGTTSSSTSSTSSILGSVLGSAIGTNSTASTISNAGTLIGGILSAFGGTTNANTIVGTWVYSKPAVQFESENLLAKAGGSVASNAVVNKLEPYYKKLGITSGKFSFTFNSDNTCSYVLNGKSYTGTYSYNSSSNTITIQGSLISFPSAYVSVSGSQMALTFDSTKLLNVAQGVASGSGNSTLSTLSTLSSAYNGMKTGFLFNRQ